jgi:hypothetical protein
MSNEPLVTRGGKDTTAISYKAFIMTMENSM